MPTLRASKNRLKRIGNSVWPARQCWTTTPSSPGAKRSPNRVTKANPRNTRASARSLGEVREGLARKLEEAEKLFGGVMDHRASVRMCNSRVRAAAEELGSVCGSQDEGEVETKQQEMVAAALDWRRKAWREYEERWQGLHELHAELSESLLTFSKGTEKTLLTEKLLAAIDDFVPASEHLQPPSRSDEGARHRTKGASIPPASKQRHLAALENFYFHHSSRIVRSLALLPTDVTDRLHRRVATGWITGHDGLTVQQRYIAAQSALANYYPRPPPSPYTAAEAKRQQDLWQQYDEALRWGGKVNGENPVRNLVNMDVDVGPFPDHLEDGRCSSAGVTDIQYHMQPSTFGKINVWRFGVNERATVEAGVVGCGGDYDDSSVADADRHVLNVGSLRFGYSSTGDLMDKSAVKTRALRAWEKRCEQLRQDLQL